MYSAHMKLIIHIHTSMIVTCLWMNYMLYCFVCVVSVMVEIKHVNYIYLNVRLNHEKCSTFTNDQQASHYYWVTLCTYVLKTETCQVEVYCKC